MIMNKYCFNVPRLGLLLAVVILMGCENHKDPQSIFKHEIQEGPTPWTFAPTPRSDSSFTFAIVADLNSDEREGIFEVAVEQLNLLNPDFILSVGDLIDGGTEDVDVLKKQFDYFDQRVSKAKAPFFYVGGNHDLTNATMRQFWIERYGQRYYHFIFNNVLFLIMDSEDYSAQRMQEIYLARAEALEILKGANPELYPQTAYYEMRERMTGEIGDQQSEYFVNVIKEHPNVKWTFIFMHKPVWKREGEGNLSIVEAALKGRNYTYINGHAHSYLYEKREGMDYINLATTGGGQNPNTNNSFDHITLVNFTEGEPVIATLRMDGILDKTGKIPLDGEKYCFQASTCQD